MRTGTKTTRAARDVAVVGPRDDAARTLNRTYLSSKAARAGAGEEEAWTRCVVDRVEARSRSLVLRVIDGSDRVFPIFAETESDERALVRIVHVLRRKGGIWGAREPGLDARSSNFDVLDFSRRRRIASEALEKAPRLGERADDGQRR